VVAGLAQGGSNGASLVAAQVVHDRYVTGLERRDQNRLDVGRELTCPPRPGPSFIVRALSVDGGLSLKTRS
jgi:hypothetical protein